MVVNVDVFIRLCYLVAFWVMLCSIMTPLQWQWPPNASFAEASNISPLHSDSSSSVQRRILTSFKQGVVEGGYGSLASWNASRPLCSWNGVGCAIGTHRVVSLNLPYFNLNGMIKPLFSMPFLTYLNVSGNSLQGSFPDNASTSFQVLDLSFNLFNGTIPDSIGKLANLEWLDLSGNNFAGRIPQQLGNLTNLVHLNLLDNAGLEGQLPSELRACTKLTLFSVGVTTALKFGKRSLISGPSKAAFAIFNNMSSLQELVLLGTQVKGSIPAEIGSLKSLQILELDQNFLQGEIPRTLGNLSNLQVLSLEFGDFTGPIPAELGSCTQLQSFYVGTSSNLGVTQALYDHNVFGSFNRNHLNGSIPESFGQLQNLQLLVIGNTQMGGRIPSFANATALQGFFLTNNQFTGPIPSDFASSLTVLDLQGNRLSGLIPRAIGNFSNLVELGIDEDDMQGIIPPELAFCQNLQVLEIGASTEKIWTVKVTGSIPEAFGRLNSLQYLKLDSTELSGTIPSSLGNCSLLTFLALGNSRLVGSLPPEISNLTALQAFYVQGNRLEGSLSAVRWDELRSLTYFDVSQNLLSGTVPESLGTSLSLLYFRASYNQLVGTLPLSFINCSSLEILDTQSNLLEGNISAALGGLPGSSLQVILFASNKFYGTIPSWVATRFNGLFILVLAGNRLEGKIPPSIWLMNSWQHPYSSYDSDPNSYVIRVLNPNSVVFYISSNGVRQPIQTLLRSFTVLDLSDNNLQGSIPEQVFNLSGLSVLNLSSNHFTGVIPIVSNNLSQIDLSHNNLTGDIPALTLASSNLEYLDLSSNNLCGPIPSIATRFDRVYFMTNLCLCGQPLDMKCPIALAPQPPPPMSSQIFDGENAALISWIAFSIGSASSFLLSMLMFLFTSRGSHFMFGNGEPLMFIRQHGWFQEPT